jgi:uncharacterized membrane protein HdeD (DUF308 family)
VAPAVPAPKSNRYWVVPAARAFAALVLAAVITFTRDTHTAEFGLIAFGVFAVVDGLVVAALSAVFAPRGVTRILFVVQGVIGVVAGILALALMGSGLGLFLYLVTVWAALTGCLELYSALRSRGKDAAARDWLVTGALTALLALAFVFIPADAVLAIGLLGAWAVVVGVFQAIGAASLRTASRSQAADQGATRA